MPLPGSDPIVARARDLLNGERDYIANAANLAAFVAANFADLNWAGFYFARGHELVLGPFWGKPAVARIARGAGVCGKAWAERRTLVVADVHAFAGHITCDAASNAEIVVPLLREGTVLGVLDLDSPRPGRFDDGDRLALEALAQLYVEACDAW